MDFAANLVLAQAASAPPSPTMIGLMLAGLALLVLVVPFVLGGMLAKSLRMADDWWRIGLLLMAIIGPAVIICPKPKYLGVGWPPKWGTDLAGGVILVFEVDLEQTGAASGGAEGEINMDALIEALKNRFPERFSVVHVLSREPHEIPLFEFDPSREAVINPSIHAPLLGFPQHAVMCWFGNVVRERTDHVEPVHHIPFEHGAHAICVIEHRGVPVALVSPGVGAPAAVSSLEITISLGATHIIGCGGAGIVQPGFDIGHVIVPTSAVRDEGTS